MLTEVQPLQPAATTTLVDDKEELNSLRDKIGQATIRWIRLLDQNHQDALQKYPKDHKYLQKNVWYAEDLAKACQASTQPKMVAFIKKGNKQLIGYLNPKFFDKIKENEGKLKFRTWHFIAKSDVLPSDALKAALQGLSIMDCGMACQMARYGALLDLLGENKFNRLFGNQVGQLMNIGLRIYDELQPMRYFVAYTEAVNKNASGEKGNRPVKVGQLVGFEGVKTYSLKCLYGPWKASNTFCIKDTPGEQKFVSLGTGPDGMTESEICQTLLDKYNQDEDDPYLLAPNDDEMVKPLLLLQSIGGKEFVSSTRKQLFPPATKVEGYNPLTPEDFIIEIIRDLIKLPLEQVSMQFVKTHQVNINRFK